MNETAAEKLNGEAQPKPEEPGFWTSAGSWLARYWMYVVGGAVAVGGGYAAYRYLGAGEEDEG